MARCTDNFSDEIIIDDLEFISRKLFFHNEQLKNKKIFISGGTGFFGKWLVKRLLYVDSIFQLNIVIGLLTRNIKNVYKRDKIFLDKRINLYEGDIRSFDFPKERYDYIIHAASTSSVDKFNGESSINRFLILSEGTKRILEFAKKSKIEKFLLISSGGVYGKDFDFTQSISEDANISPSTLDVDSCYGEGKRVAELLCTMYASKYNFDLKIARCFSFVGPYMDFDIHFAIGNFIKNACERKDIVIHGDGSQIRTYMYVSDMIVWVLKILFIGKNNTAYNVGSDVEVSIKHLALKIVDILSLDIKVDVLQKYKNIDTTSRYVPSVELAKSTLNLELYTSLDEAILKTAKFLLEFEKENDE